MMIDLSTRNLCFEQMAQISDWRFELQDDMEGITTSPRATVLPFVFPFKLYVWPHFSFYFASVPLPESKKLAYPV